MKQFYFETGSWVDSLEKAIKKGKLSKEYQLIVDQTRNSEQNKKTKSGLTIPTRFNKDLVLNSLFEKDSRDKIDFTEPLKKKKSVDDIINLQHSLNKTFKTKEREVTKVSKTSGETVKSSFLKKIEKMLNRPLTAIEDIFAAKLRNITNTTEKSGFWSLEDIEGQITEFQKDLKALEKEANGKISKEIKIKTEALAAKCKATMDEFISSKSRSVDKKVSTKAKKTSPKRWKEIWDMVGRIGQKNVAKMYPELDISNVVKDIFDGFKLSNTKEDKADPFKGYKNLIEDVNKIVQKNSTQAKEAFSKHGNKQVAAYLGLFSKSFKNGDIISNLLKVGEKDTLPTITANLQKKVANYDDLVKTLNELRNSLEK